MASDSSTDRASRDDFQHRELLAQDDLAGRVEPFLQDCGVDSAEINDHFQVAVVVQVREAGLRAVDAGLDSGAEQEHRLRQAVVGAAAIVLARTPAELAEGERQHALVVLLASQIFVERAYRLIEFVQQLVEPSRLVGVCVVSAELGDSLRCVIHARGHATIDQGCNSAHRAAELRIGIFDGCAIPADHRAHRLAGIVGAGCSPRDELQFVSGCRFHRRVNAFSQNCTNT